MEAVQAAAEKLGIDVLNTRVKKNGPNDFTLLIASASTQPPSVQSHDLKGLSFQLKVEYGDFSGPLTKTVAALKEVRREPLSMFKNEA